MKIVAAAACTILLLLSAVNPGFAQSVARGKKPAPPKKEVSHFYLVPTVGGYSFSSGDDFETGLLYGARVGYLFAGKGVVDSLGVELFGAAVDTRSRQDDSSVTGYLFRVDAIYNLMQGRFVPFLSLGAGWLTFEGDTDSDSRVIIAPGLGMKYALSNHLDLRADVRRPIPFDPDEDPNWEYTLGLSYLFGKVRTIAPPPPPDADRDGVPDKADKCPDTPRNIKVDRFGCPPDADGDGVPDHLDKCPDTPRGAKVDTSGCNADSDGDGVPDDKDKCPGTPPGIEVDEQGCVPPTHLSLFIVSSGGTVAPTHGLASASTTNFPPTAISPPAQSETTPGTGRIGAVASAAAALETPSVKRPEEPYLRVEFLFDRSDIQENYFAPLQQLISILKASESLGLLIEGHTDSRGSVAHNQKLSWERAENVKKYLLNQGVEQNRIQTQGLGSERPTADNVSETGRQRNRRADVTVLPESDK